VYKAIVSLQKMYDLYLFEVSKCQLRSC